MIKCNVNEMIAAYMVIVKIINEGRQMGTKVMYRFTRMQAKLVIEFDPANKTRDAMIIAYDHKVDGGYGVPANEDHEFQAKWKLIGESLLEFDLLPVPVDWIVDKDGDGPLSMLEIINLGPFLTEEAR